MCRDTDEEESVSSMLSELHYKKKKNHCPTNLYLVVYKSGNQCMSFKM